MNHLIRNKKELYLCKRKMKNDRIVYEEPQRYLLNYQPLNSVGEIVAVGNEYINRLIFYTDIETGKNFHNFDRCYVYKKIPEPDEYNEFACDGDFYVDGEPQVYMEEVTVFLQRMTGDENE